MNILWTTTTKNLTFLKLVNHFQRAFKLQEGRGNKDFFYTSDRFIKLIITRWNKLKNENKTHNRAWLSSIYSTFNGYCTQTCSTSACNCCQTETSHASQINYSKFNLNSYFKLLWNSRGCFERQPDDKD